MINKTFRIIMIIIFTFLIVLTSIFVARKDYSIEDTSEAVSTEEDVSNWLKEEEGSSQEEKTTINSVESILVIQEENGVVADTTRNVDEKDTTTMSLGVVEEQEPENIDYNYDYEYFYDSSYPVAAEVWVYLKNAGWSDAAAAGAIGNMMLECGGWTMDLQPYADGGGYYGLCQWDLTYADLYYGASVEEQLSWLVESAPSALSGFGYYDYINLTDPGYAAVVFANYYERCADWAVAGRSEAAWEAYNYFVG